MNSAPESPPPGPPPYQTPPPKIAAPREAPTVARLCRYAGVVLNALTALAWGGLGLLTLGTGGSPLLAIMPFVLVALYTATAWGFIQRSAWALGRSYRVHALGAFIDVYEVVAQHQMLYAPLLILHILALAATHFAKPDF